MEKNWLYMGMWKSVEENILGHYFQVYSYQSTYNIFIAHCGKWGNHSEMEATFLSTPATPVSD